MSSATGFESLRYCYLDALILVSHCQLSRRSIAVMIGGQPLVVGIQRVGGLGGYRASRRRLQGIDGLVHGCAEIIADATLAIEPYRFIVLLILST